MFGLKLFKRNQPPVTRQPSSRAPVAQAWAAPVPRASGPPPPPPPPEAFLSAQAAAVPPFAIPSPFPIEDPQEEARVADSEASVTSEAPPAGAPTPARVRFFYSDGTVSEPDAEETDRLGYLATNLLEASRDDIG